MIIPVPSDLLELSKDRNPDLTVGATTARRCAPLKRFKSQRSQVCHCRLNGFHFTFTAFHLAEARCE